MGPGVIRCKRCTAIACRACVARVGYSRPFPAERELFHIDLDESRRSGVSSVGTKVPTVRPHGHNPGVQAIGSVTVMVVPLP
jgi:hypothetical protein